MSRLMGRGSGISVEFAGFELRSHPNESGDGIVFVETGAVGTDLAVRGYEGRTMEEEGCLN